MTDKLEPYENYNLIGELRSDILACQGTLANLLPKDEYLNIMFNIDVFLFDFLCLYIDCFMVNEDDLDKRFEKVKDDILKFKKALDKNMENMRKEREKIMN